MTSVISKTQRIHVFSTIHRFECRGGERRPGTSERQIPEGVKLARETSGRTPRSWSGPSSRRWYSRRVCAGADLVRGVATGHGGAAPSTRSSVRHGVARGTHCSRRFGRIRARTSRRAKSTRRAKVPAALTARVPIFFSRWRASRKSVVCSVKWRHIVDHDNRTAIVGWQCEGGRRREGHRWALRHDYKACDVRYCH